MNPFHLAVLAITGLTTPAAVAADNSRAVLPRACAADVKKLCADVRPGDGRLAQCLRNHADALSDDCRTAIRNANAAGMTK